MKMKLNPKEAEFLRLIKKIKNGEIEIQITNGKPIVTSSLITLSDSLFYGNKKLYDKTYHRMKLLLSNKRFLEKLKELRMKHNIPPDGFKEPKNYKEWFDKTEKKFKPTKKKVRILSINQKTKKIVTKTQPIHLSNVEEELANDTEKLIKKFYLNEKFFQPIRWLIFYNNLEYATPSLKIKLKQNQKGKIELWLGILSHTKKRDITSLSWRTIKSLQQYLPNFRSRLKEWANLERDYEIYKLYQRYRRELGSRKRAKTVKYMLQMEMPIDEHISDKIKGKYPNITLANIRKIISRFKKKSSDI